jgi:hypothetical protein
VARAQKRETASAQHRGVGKCVRGRTVRHRLTAR